MYPPGSAGITEPWFQNLGNNNGTPQLATGATYNEYGLPGDQLPSVPGYSPIGNNQAPGYIGANATPVGYNEFGDPFYRSSIGNNSMFTGDTLSGYPSGQYYQGGVVYNNAPPPNSLGYPGVNPGVLTGYAQQSPPLQGFVDTPGGGGPPGYPPLIPGYPTPGYPPLTPGTPLPGPYPQQGYAQQPGLSNGPFVPVNPLNIPNPTIPGYQPFNLTSVNAPAALAGPQPFKAGGGATSPGPSVTPPSQLPGASYPYRIPGSPAPQSSMTSPAQTLSQALNGPSQPSGAPNSALYSTDVLGLGGGGLPGGTGPRSIPLNPQGGGVPIASGGSPTIASAPPAVGPNGQPPGSLLAQAQAQNNAGPAPAESGSPQPTQQELATQQGIDNSRQALSTMLTNQQSNQEVDLKDAKAVGDQITKEFDAAKTQTEQDTNQEVSAAHAALQKNIDSDLAPLIRGGVNAAASAERYLNTMEPYASQEKDKKEAIDMAKQMAADYPKQGKMSGFLRAATNISQRGFLAGLKASGAHPPSEDPSKWQYYYPSALANVEAASGDYLKRGDTLASHAEKQLELANTLTKTVFDQVNKNFDTYDKAMQRRFDRIKDAQEAIVKKYETQISAVDKARSREYDAVRNALSFYADQIKDRDNAKRLTVSQQKNQLTAVMRSIQQQNADTKTNEAAERAQHHRAIEQNYNTQNWLNMYGKNIQRAALPESQRPPANPFPNPGYFIPQGR